MIEDINTIYQYLWDAIKVVLRVKFIATSVYEKTWRYHVKKLTIQLNKLEKQQNNSKIKRGIKER